MMLNTCQELDIYEIILVFVEVDLKVGILMNHRKVKHS